MTSHIMFFFNASATIEIYTLSLHDALPIWWRRHPCRRDGDDAAAFSARRAWCGPNRCQRSEEHTSELQSRRDLVCRLLLEKKKHYYLNFIPLCKVNIFFTVYIQLSNTLICI